LSGGEKMRLYLCCLMISNQTPDLIILDEPTNNLDISSLQILTQTIKRYKGSLLVISHDRYFVEEVGVDKEMGVG
jgi:ATPase subunit of ABC transporter with duplicated ATPase domains